jgi:hypothetical protein
MENPTITFPLWSTNGPRPSNILPDCGTSNLHASAPFSAVVCGPLLGEGGALRRSSVSCSRLSIWLHAWIQNNRRRWIVSSRVCSSHSDSSSSSPAPVRDKRDAIWSKSVDSDGVGFRPCRCLISCKLWSECAVITRQKLFTDVYLTPEIFLLFVLFDLELSSFCRIHSFCWSFRVE